MNQPKETPPASATGGADQNNIVFPKPSGGATPPQPQNKSFQAFQNIPAELRALPQWVCWRLEQVKGRQTKVPYNPVTGSHASVDKPETWGTFEAASTAVATKKMDGIGFVLTDGDPYTGIDIDDKKDNPASDHERAVHTAILANVDSYTERSPGERWVDDAGNERGGYHIIVRGRIDAGRDRGHVGLYSSKRYLTFTGDVVHNALINDYQLFLHNMASQMPAPTGIELEDVESSRSDAEVHEMACNAANGEKYQELCTGDWAGMGYRSQSEADHALLSIIAFYTPSNEQVRRIFRCTGLGKREKATRDDKHIDRSLKKIRAKELTDADLAQVKADAENLIARAVVEPIAPRAPNDYVDVEDDLPPIKGPVATEAMYYGLVGKVMHAACNGTEVNPAAAGLAFMTFASAALGRERYVSISDTDHHSRIYSVHVGRSSRAGKGMALALTKRIRVEAEHQGETLESDTVCGNFHNGGLSSREGLGWLIRDPSDEKDKDGNSLDPGVEDKRLFVLEEELANVLKQAARDGNTLSTAIRTAWDGDDIAPATKTNRTRATSPHISIHACITPYELQKSLDQNNLTNGFANRFLFASAERIGFIPNPLKTPDAIVESLARELLAAIIASRTPGEVTATDEARRLYNAFYIKSRRGRGLTEQLRGLLERHTPYAWRLALTFALLDCKDKIDEGHMKAALAWLEYCHDSTKFIFSDARQENEVSKTSDRGDRIIALLKQAPEQMLDRKSLHDALSKPTKEELNAALQEVQDAGHVEEKTTPRQGGGRPLRQYRLKPEAPPAPATGKSRKGGA